MKKQKNNTLNLTSKDVKVIVETLENPPKPNKALQDAASRYKKTLS